MKLKITKGQLRMLDFRCWSLDRSHESTDPSWKLRAEMWDLFQVAHKTKSYAIINFPSADLLKRFSYETESMEKNTQVFAQDNGTPDYWGEYKSARSLNRNVKTLISNKEVNNG